MYMDIEKVFGLFDNEEPDSLLEKARLVDQLLDYKEHPLFWVGMFKKLIHNHKTFNSKVLEFYSKMDEELDIYDVEVAGEFVVYNRAWFWISKINIQDRDNQEAILHYGDEYLTTYFKFIISYFEEFEEYEKCAHIKTLLDYTQLTLKIN
jgi:hypothetical protein